MGMVTIHCWGCSAGTTVDEHASAEGLARAGWSLSHGETYCPECARARGLIAPVEAPGAAPEGTATAGGLEPFPVSALSGESRFGRSLRLLGASLRLLREEPKLAVFPVVSFVLSVVVGVVCFGTWGPAPHAGGTVSREALLVPALIAAYPLTFVSVYCSVALAAVLRLRLEGSGASVGDGFSAANQRIGVIAAWTLLVCTVGLLLRGLEERLPLAGRIAANLFGLAWSLATLFAIPVLTYEGRGPFATVRRSTEIFKVRWGSSIFGGAGIGLAGSLAAIPFLLILVLGAAKPSGGAALVVLGGAGLCAVVAATAALEQIYRIFVYRSAIGLDTSAGPFAVSDLRQPLSRRRRGAS
jgi:hypothetical protein